jgi:hypothetical protein
MLLVEQLPLPSSSSEPQTVEQEIGQVMLAAVRALANGILDHMSTGKLTAAARERGAEALAKLYTLRRDNPDIGDFEDVCRVYGKKALQAYFATLSDPPEATEARSDWLIGWALTLHREVFFKRVR